MSVLTEKQVITEFLEAYKCLPCLWDQSDNFYTSKAAREQAYEILVEKLRPIQEDATIDVIKKKIENMRTAYKREYKKVQDAKAAGGEHFPKLWYYKNMCFLEKEWPSFAEDTNIRSSNYSSGEEEESVLKRHLQHKSPPKLIYEEVPKKKVKTNRLSYVDVQKQEAEDPLPDPVNHENFLTSTAEASDTNFYEAESFGKTVGHQLQQLSHLQKTIAEKLISDVIFHARLDKLNVNSVLNLNEEYS